VRLRGDLINGQKINLTDDTAKPIDQFIGPHESFDSLDWLALVEDDHGGQGFDIVAAGEAGVFFGVDFDNLDTTTEVIVDFFKDFGHHFAGATPFSVEVHQYRVCRSSEEFVKVAEFLFNGHDFQIYCDRISFDRNAKWGRCGEIYRAIVNRSF
jgi:hypothetical protein